MKYQYLTIKNCKVFYREAGNPENPTILLLHGFPRNLHVLLKVLADTKIQKYFKKYAFPATLWV